MMIGKASEGQAISPLLLNNQPLGFTDSYKYLGVDICAGRCLTFSATNTIRSFHRAANSVLYSRVKPKNEVLMRILYTNCVPIITYASAAKEFSATDMTRCHVAVNNCIRKIFSFALWESIRHLRISYGYDSIYEIFASSKVKFMTKATASSNAIVRFLSSLPLD